MVHFAQQYEYEPLALGSVYSDAVVSSVCTYICVYMCLGGCGYMMWRDKRYRAVQRPVVADSLQRLRSSGTVASGQYKARSTPLACVCGPSAMARPTLSTLTRVCTAGATRGRPTSMSLLTQLRPRSASGESAEEVEVAYSSRPWRPRSLCNVAVSGR